MRLDQWLWAVRVYPSRTASTAAIRSGAVRVNATVMKPAHEPRTGEVVVAKVGRITRTLRVLAMPPSRVGAKLVPGYAEDLTPPEEYQRPREAQLLPPGYRPRGSGRPTKRERREIDELEM
jgi:ribosome-associated heat shock protein Hsp15